jgi:NAD(P)-dependent dehydrogenase (short-subunit alcohol dehydrogenase family)
MSLSITDLFSVKGKVALVTGGATGIGRMIASGLVENGAEVYIASRKLDMCQKAARELSASGTCVPLQVDLQDLGSIQQLAADVQRRSPVLNILINNSGTGWAEPYEEYSAEGWDKVFDINVKAPFFLTKDSSNNFAYGASKAAVHHLSGMLAGLLGPRHVTVNVIAPGPFPARMMQRSGRLEKLVATVPLGRAGSDEDAAGTALFLCARAGAFVNGVVLPLDGGRLTNTFND